MIRSNFMSTKPVRVCCPFDWAIDHAKTDLPLYITTRNEDIVFEREGMRVQWYYVRRIPRSAAAEIESTSSNRMVAQLRAFQIGVVQVDGLHKDDGSVEDGWKPLCYRDSNQRDPRQGMTTEELDLFPTDEKFDIGEVVLRRAGLRQGRQPFFQPPESSVRASAEAKFLCAAVDPELASLKLGAPEGA